jgi:putative ABC transport system permease protein
MLRKHLRIAWRRLSKDKGFLINGIGLSLGLAGFIMIALFVRDEFAYDKYNTNAPRIFRIEADLHLNGGTVEDPFTPPPMAAALKRDFPAIENAVRIRSDRQTVAVRIGDKVFDENAAARADPTLFEIFTFPMLAGNPHTALSAPNSIVLSATAAKRYFNTTDVIGKTLKLDEDSTIYSITAVIKDMPAQSHFHFDLIKSLRQSRQDWINLFSSTYILTKPGVTTADIDRMLTQTVDKYLNPQRIKQGQTTSDYFRYYAIPLTRIHLYSNLPHEFEPNGSITYTILFIIVAILVLGIASINYVNLMIALSIRRLQEIGIRKVLGSSRSQLAGQFLLESILTTAIAMTLALILVAGLLPWIHRLTGKQFDTTFLLSAKAIASIIGITITVGLVSGAYPAFLLSGLQALKSLRSQVSVGAGSGVLRTALLVFQFSVAMILIIGTGVIYSQLFYIRHQSLGYNREQLVTIKNTFPMQDHVWTFADEAGRLPGVLNTTVSGFLPNQKVVFRAYFKDRSGREDKMALLGFWRIDTNYLHTLGMQLAAGRNFQLSTDSASVLINETAARMLGYTHPLGERIYTMNDTAASLTDTTAGYRIVGIIKDFNSASLRDPIDPIVFQMLMKDDGANGVTFRLAPGDFPATLRGIQHAYQPFAGGRPFVYTFLDDDFNRLYQADRRMGELFTIFAILAIIIAGLGMFGLVTATTEQRTKELGIRRVLGARAADLGLLLLKGYGLAIGLAVLIALPAGAWVMHNWLQGFAYRTPLHPLLFLVAPLMAIALALGIVGAKARQAANANLATTLRAE